MSTPTFSYIPGRDYRASPAPTSSYEYDLSTHFIAQHPAIPRDSCKLMVIDRARHTIEHRVFTDIVEYLDAGDLLVINDTRVLPARLHLNKVPSGGTLEIMLLAGIESVEQSTQRWECLAKPAKRAKVGAQFEAHDEQGNLLMTATIEEEQDRGRRIVMLEASPVTVDEVFHRIGSVPLPPYIVEELDDDELYQTVYADDEHSAAAPTAGLHFTEELLERIKTRGVDIATVRLDVGLDTFRPITTEDPLQHQIHTEYLCVSPETVTAIRATKQRGGRVIAVGTTTTRALETAYQAARARRIQGSGDLMDPDDARAEDDFVLEPFAGRSGLFIAEGYEFGIVDALITNFHVPRSTLMMMVSAFADRKVIIDAYQQAQEHGYRFFSFGDAMLIQ